MATKEHLQELLHLLKLDIQDLASRRAPTDDLNFKLDFNTVRTLKEAFDLGALEESVQGARMLLQILNEFEKLEKINPEV